jgi:hypothetical protein
MPEFLSGHTSRRKGKIAVAVQSLIDLDELVLRCRDEQAREYIREAVACYKAGAYRSCIVATWIGVVFDYLHKMRELELSGDRNAKKTLDDFEKIRGRGESGLKEALDFERKILVVAAKDFELLTPLEKEDLERLYKDRNRCAHPSMHSVEDPYQPTAELARTHLRSAVEILLQREPVQGKAALDRIWREVKSNYFPEDTEGAIKHFEAGPLRNARESLVRNAVVALTKSLLNDDLPKPEQRRQFAALNAILEMHRAVCEKVLQHDLPSIGARLEDDRLAFLVQFFRSVPISWLAAGDSIRDKK